MALSPANNLAESISLLRAIFVSHFPKTKYSPAFIIVSFGNLYGLEPPSSSSSFKPYKLKSSSVGLYNSIISVVSEPAGLGKISVIIIFTSPILTNSFTSLSTTTFFVLVEIKKAVVVV